MHRATPWTLLLGLIGLTFAAGALAAVEPDDTAHVAAAHREIGILAHLSNTPRLHAFDISVFVAGSEAVLAGNVDNAASKTLAGNIAAAQAGIDHVVNHIVVDAEARRPQSD